MKIFAKDKKVIDLHTLSIYVKMKQADLKKLEFEYLEK